MCNRIHPYTCSIPSFTRAPVNFGAHESVYGVTRVEHYGPDNFFSSYVSWRSCVCSGDPSLMLSATRTLMMATMSAMIATLLATWSLLEVPPPVGFAAGEITAAFAAPPLAAPPLAGWYSSKSLIRSFRLAAIAPALRFSKRCVCVRVCVCLGSEAYNSMRSDHAHP